MDDILDKGKGSMSLFERVLHGVPGIKGYKEKEMRRETDKTIRTTVATRLQDERTRLDRIQADVAAAGQLSLLDDLDRVGKKLQLLIDRIRTASYGYAPLFDLIKVKEEQIDALIQYDEGLLSGVERIKTIIDNMMTLHGRPETEWMESIRALSTTIDNMNTDFNHRDEVILQATEVPPTEVDEEPEE